MHSLFLPSLVILGGVAALQWFTMAYVQRGESPARQRTAKRAVAISVGLLCLGYILQFETIERLFPTPLASWIRAAILCWAIVSIPLCLVSVVSRRLLPPGRPMNPQRRAVLRIAQTAALAAPAAALGYGAFIERRNLRLREQDILIPNLAPDLHGLRLVQVTDVHLGPFLSERELAYAIDAANETRAHIALMTGDLISSGGDPLDACIAQIARLRADAGIFGCLGNHEMYAEVEDYATEQAARRGIRFLRWQRARLRFGSSTLNLAGLDYQRSDREYLVGMKRFVVPGEYNILLSHNPDVFPTAVKQGYDLTISGHTHGGQVRVEILQQNLNIARFMTPYVDGLYRSGHAAAFVSRGIGTIGIPARVGAPPEVVLLRLLRA